MLASTVCAHYRTRHAPIPFRVGRCAGYPVHRAIRRYFLSDRKHQRLRASEGKRLSWLAVFMFFWGVGLFVIAIATSGPEDHATANLPEALDAAGIVFFSFLIQLLFPRRVYNLILRTHGADVEVLASRQRKSILDVKQAVETALAAHVQRSHPTDRTASQILVVIPGRRSEAEALRASPRNDGVLCL